MNSQILSVNYWEKVFLVHSPRAGYRKAQNFPQKEKSMSKKGSILIDHVLSVQPGLPEPWRGPFWERLRISKCPTEKRRRDRDVGFANVGEVPKFSTQNLHFELKLTEIFLLVLAYSLTCGYWVVAMVQLLEHWILIKWSKNRYSSVAEISSPCKVLHSI